SFHNIKKLLYLIISDYALEIKRSGFSVYEHLSIVPDIKKDGKLTWLSSLFLLLDLYFILNPWL
ncbi:hypothetical protein EFS08_09095, partial [Leuconostoc suionicum]|nr:hypothetical protein [Leuconostoc suionicum]